jgi:two-component system sensor histidine kinase RegB
MSTTTLFRPGRPPRNVRLDTLLRLRWVAVIGQGTAVLVVRYGLDFSFPVFACLAVIALSAWLNIALRVRFRVTQRLEPERAAWLLAFDIAELAVLLFLTGGLQNPFAFLFLGPVLMSATAMPPVYTLRLAGFAMACATVLAFVHYPLPWNAADPDPLELPALYIVGIWFSLLLAIGSISVQSWQVTQEARQLSDALAATELVMAREQHLSQLDGLAAAAAHELGTPLSTISVISRELERAIEPDSPHVDDVRLLREQAGRCRDILSKITELSASGAPYDRMPLSALIEEVATPHRHLGVAIEVQRDAGSEPIGTRNAGILYGLGNLLENAVDFANERVDIFASWNEHDVSVTIIDDGPGFAPEIMERIGEPYVTSRRRRRGEDVSEGGGLGLGFFIAKTLLERSGATLSFENRTPPAHGAVVRVQWPRAVFEQTSALA